MDFLSKVSAKAGETLQTIKDSDITKKAKNYAKINIKKKNKCYYIVQ